MCAIIIYRIPLSSLLHSHGGQIYSPAHQALSFLYIINANIFYYYYMMRAIKCNLGVNMGLGSLDIDHVNTIELILYSLADQ